jgi:sirohydrochlorin ferrochelatase
MTPLILVARGSRDSAASQVVFELARRVAAHRPGARVRAAFLHHEVPDLRAALAKEAALTHRHAIVVPLLLSDGHGARVDIRTQVDGVGRTGLPISVRIADPVGPADDADVEGRRLLAAALLRRLTEARIDPRSRPAAPDAIVVAAVGSRVARAMLAPVHVARSLASTTGARCRVAYLVNGAPSIVDTVRDLNARGATEIAVAPYLLARGAMFARAAALARVGGAVGVSAPLGDAPELVELVLRRADQARG